MPQTYSFLSNSGNFVEVEAEDEATARNKAMFKLWGQPDKPWLPARWEGKGLMLRGRPQ